jgi:hypothetical protein
MTWKPSFRCLAMVVRVFVVMMNLLGDLWLVATASASGGDSTGEVQSYLAKWKSKVWPYLVVSSNGLVECIVLWARTFSSVKNYDLWSDDDGACALFPS